MTDSTGTQNGHRAPLRIALFGDSIASGLGVRNKRYADITAGVLGADLIDYSRTGTTVVDALSAYRSDPRQVEVAIIAHGVTEAILRPTVRAVRLLPSRWRRRGWMDPRPYYSRRPWKRALERFESGLRWRVKNLLLRRPSMACQVVDIDQYAEAMSELITTLTGAGAQVVVLGTPPIDDRFFPGSQDEQLRYALIAGELAPVFVPLVGVMREWDDFFADRFHPNENGHARIAKLLTDTILALPAIEAAAEHRFDSSIAREDEGNS